MRKIKVVLDWFPNTIHTGFLLAQQRGYFARHGLEVEMTGQVHSVMELHEADIVMGPEMSMLEQMAHGMEITAVATVTQRCDSGIVALKSSGIASMKDLEGKRLSHFEPRWFHGVIGEAMRLSGGDYRKVRLVQLDVGDIVTALDTRVDATWVYASWENEVLQDAGREIAYIDLAEIDPLFDFCAPSLAATRRMIETRPDDLAAFLEALERGYADAARDPESVLSVRDGLPAVSDAVLLRGQRHLAGLLLDETGHWGAMKPARWNRMADWMVQNGYSDKRRNTEFTNDFLPGHRSK